MGTQKNFKHRLKNHIRTGCIVISVKIKSKNNTQQSHMCEQ